mmetsp:Transcript_6320/g.9832  ORF Transcript_6320/g.9832 Transcript_6320/m.9832 type:complete len:290 (+) Transcript_6320:269-1138(+)
MQKARQNAKNAPLDILRTELGKQFALPALLALLPANRDLWSAPLANQERFLSSPQQYSAVNAPPVLMPRLLARNSATLVLQAGSRTAKVASSVINVLGEGSLVIKALSLATNVLLVGFLPLSAALPAQTALPVLSKMSLGSLSALYAKLGSSKPLPKVQAAMSARLELLQTQLARLCAPTVPGVGPKTNKVLLPATFVPQASALPRKVSFARLAKTPKWLLMKEVKSAPIVQKELSPTLSTRLAFARLGSLALSKRHELDLLPLRHCHQARYSPQSPPHYHHRRSLTKI